MVDVEFLGEGRLLTRHGKWMSVWDARTGELRQRFSASDWLGDTVTSSDAKTLIADTYSGQLSK